jgi:hypothetical protein
VNDLILLSIDPGTTQSAFVVVDIRHLRDNRQGQGGERCADRHGKDRILRYTGY